MDWLESELAGVAGENWGGKRPGGIGVEVGGGRELALVDAWVERDCLAAGEESKLAGGVDGEDWGSRRGGGGSKVEADGGRELALVEDVERGREGGREEARWREEGEEWVGGCSREVEELPAELDVELERELEAEEEEEEEGKEEEERRTIFR